MEIHAIQLLGSHDIDPASGSAGSTLVDSETGEALGLSLDPSSRARYADLLTSHTEAVRHHCLGAHINFVSARANQPHGENSISVLSSMGLFV